MIYDNIVFKKPNHYYDLTIEKPFSGILYLAEYLSETDNKESYAIWISCVYNQKVITVNVLIRDYISSQKTITNNIEDIYAAIDYESNFIEQRLISYGYNDIYINLYTIDTVGDGFRIEKNKIKETQSNFLIFRNDYYFIPIEHDELIMFGNEAIRR